MSRTPKARGLFWISDAEYPEDSGFICFEAEDRDDARRQGAEWLGHGDDVTGVSVSTVTKKDIDALQEMADRTQEIPPLVDALEDARDTIRFSAFKDGFCQPCAEVIPSLGREQHAHDCPVKATLAKLSERLSAHRPPQGRRKGAGR